MLKAAISKTARCRSMPAGKGSSQGACGGASPNPEATHSPSSASAVDTSGGSEGGGAPLPASIFASSRRPVARAAAAFTSADGSRAALTIDSAHQAVGKDERGKAGLASHCCCPDVSQPSQTAMQQPQCLNLAASRNTIQLSAALHRFDHCRSHSPTKRCSRPCSSSRAAACCAMAAAICRVE